MPVSQQAFLKRHSKGQTTLTHTCNAVDTGWRFKKENPR
nr:MAG TPA: C6 domain protein [Caudoviricetes sp.]